MFEVKVSPQAVEDLLEIKDYIENELLNPIVAQNTVEKIVEIFENLANYPEIGIPVERYVSFSTDYKFVLANNYFIFLQNKRRLCEGNKNNVFKTGFCENLVWR